MNTIARTITLVIIALAALTLTACHQTTTGAHPGTAATAQQKDAAFLQGLRTLHPDATGTDAQILKFGHDFTTGTLCTNPLTVKFAVAGAEDAGQSHEEATAVYELGLRVYCPQHLDYLSP